MLEQLDFHESLFIVQGKIRTSVNPVAVCTMGKFFYRKVEFFYRKVEDEFKENKPNIWRIISQIGRIFKQFCNVFLFLMPQCVHFCYLWLTLTLHWKQTIIFMKWLLSALCVTWNELGNFPRPLNLIWHGGLLFISLKVTWVCCRQFFKSSKLTFSSYPNDKDTFANESET